MTENLMRGDDGLPADPLSCGCCGRSGRAMHELGLTQGVYICRRCAFYALRFADLGGGHGRGRRRTTSDLGRTRRMPSIVVQGFEPCFSVTDVERAVAHYQRLGFSTEYHDESYAFAHMDRDLTIHLAQADPADRSRSVLYMHVNDADRLAKDWREAGMTVTGPADFDYGKREGSHLDPDGNLLRFGSPLPG